MLLLTPMQLLTPMLMIKIKSIYKKHFSDVTKNSARVEIDAGRTR